MGTKNLSIKYHLMAVITVIIWGTTFISTKILINNGLSPVEIFFYRFLMAYLCIWFFTPKTLLSKSKKDEFLFVLLGLCGGSLYFVAENMALGITLASNVSLIICTAPLLTAFLSFIVYRKKEKPTKNLIYGSLLALVGVTLVIFNGSFVLQLNPLGDFLTVLAALSWAFYGLILRKMENNYPTLFITRKVFFYGIVTLLPIMYFQPIHFNKDILFRPSVILNLSFLGFIASMLCFFMWNTAVKKLGVVRTSNYIYVVPLVTLLTSSLVLEEQITKIAILGSICILLGVYMAERGINLQFIKNITQKRI
ncbi:EamA family transporter [Apibacter adventoris]|uniref:EamA family transporter n=2 Tax=Apibacter adventoris TaxID=1679466 RepID=A0A2S8AE60_9FLAO|nr:EamA family transporter [Apibacter adventoris]